MSIKSDWNYPEPRKGISGQWDKFVGPGSTLSEQIVALLPAILAAFAIIYYSYVSNLEWSLIQYIIAALLAFDIIGGVATNATSSAKRWYHRNGQTAPKHLAFVAIHILQIFLVSWLFRNLDIPYIAVVFFNSLYKVHFSPLAAPSRPTYQIKYVCIRINPNYLLQATFLRSCTIHSPSLPSPCPEGTIEER